MLHKLHFLLILGATIPKICFASVNQVQLNNSGKTNLNSFLHLFLKNDELLRHCMIQLFFYEFDSSNDQWKDTIDLITSTAETGITVSKVTGYPGDSKKAYTQPEKISHSQRCSIVLLCINLKEYSSLGDESLRNASILPLIRPPTIRNRDKYLILAEEDAISNICQSKIFKSLKYKILLKVDKPAAIRQNQLQAHSLSIQLFNISIFLPCQYGACNGKSNLITIDIGSESALETLFPDQEKNFYGHQLTLSTTTKVPQLLEMNIVKGLDGNDIYYPKRGLYAFVLEELSKRLNFTYKILPSSGGGSTGHALPNGTWVGIVGDTYRGEVDFGFMAAITYPRFQFSEFCAPINFAYIGFVTGPPRKSYAWNAILWPFNIVMWIALIMAVFIASMVVSLIYKVSTNFDNNFWTAGYSPNSNTFLGSTGMLTRVLVEQSNLPNSFSSSFRSFIACWLIFCLVCSAAYQCKMVSLLTFPVYDHIPTSFDELATAQAAKDFAVDFHYFGNVGYTYFKTSTNPSFISIFNKMGREPDPLKCLQRALGEKAACIIFIITFQELLYRNLSDLVGKSPLKFTPHDGAMFPAGVIHEYGAPFSVNFKSVLNPAMETGLIPFWQQEDLNQVLKNKNEWQKASSIDGNAAVWGKEINDNLLRVRNLTGAFIIFGVGLTAAIFAFVGENSRKLFSCAISCWVMVIMMMVKRRR